VLEVNTMQHASFPGEEAAAHQALHPANSLHPTNSPHTKLASERLQGKKAARNLRFMPRGDPKLVAQEGNVWYVYEDGFLHASRVHGDEYAQVWDVTGCSAAFFFDTAGRASVAHLSAGVEPAQAREAASQARQAGTFDSVVVYSTDSLKTRDIKSAIRAVLGDSVDVFENVYRLSDLRRGESWEFTHRSGDTTNSVTAAITRC
jgi:hypothetical protein